MVIRKMNTVLVKHNKILFGIFSIVIIVSFVWFFTPGLDGSMFFGARNQAPNAVVGSVFGKNITNKQFQQAFQSVVLIRIILKQVIILNGIPEIFFVPPAFRHPIRFFSRIDRILCISIISIIIISITSV